MAKKTGWKGESERHSMAKKGVKTSKVKKYPTKRQARYRFGGEYDPNETREMKRMRRKEIMREAEKQGVEDPESLFYKPEFEAEGKKNMCVNLNGHADKQKMTEKDVDKEQLKLGIKIEMEHTDDPKVAKKIALDHLAEIPDYYTRLMKMEKSADIHDKKPKKRMV